VARLVLYRGKWYAAETRDGKTVRRALRTSDRATAERRLADLTRKPDTTAIIDAAEAHLARCAGKASLPAMMHAWKALKPTFASYRVDQITPELCARYRAKRLKQGVTDGTVLKELSFLRSAVRKTKAGAQAVFEMPPQPPPQDRWLTEAEVTRLVAAMPDGHLRLFTILAVTTAARSGALLDLTWDRVDLERRQIALGEPQEGRKRRAVVPINDTAFAALRAAQQASASDYVIDYAGRQVASIKKGFREAAKRAGLEGVTPHMLRHTAATWMAQKGVPMIEIARYLGHSNPAITYRVYAKHTPDYLLNAAAAVELKGVFLGTREPETVNAGRTKGAKRKAETNRKDRKTAS
jgi:integrase